MYGLGIVYHLVKLFLLVSFKSMWYNLKYTQKVGTDLPWIFPNSWIYLQMAVMYWRLFCAVSEDDFPCVVPALDRLLEIEKQIAQLHFVSTGRYTSTQLGLMYEQQMADLKHTLKNIAELRALLSLR